MTLYYSNQCRRKRRVGAGYAICYTTCWNPCLIRSHLLFPMLLQYAVIHTWNFVYSFQNLNTSSAALGRNPSSLEYVFIAKHSQKQENSLICWVPMCASNVATAMLSQAVLLNYGTTTLYFTQEWLYHVWHLAAIFDLIFCQLSNQFEIRQYMKATENPQILAPFVAVNRPFLSFQVCLSYFRGVTVWRTQTLYNEGCLVQK